MASVREETGLSVYRKFLVELSLELSTKDLETLKYAAVDFIPLGRTENMGSGLQFFDALEQDMRIGPRNLTLLQDMFETIFRVDLAQRIQAFSKERAKFETDDGLNDMVTDRGGDVNGTETPASDPADTSIDGFDDMVTDGGGDMNGTETPASDPADTRNTDGLDDMVTDGGGDMNGTETPESDPADTRNTGTSKAEADQCGTKFRSVQLAHQPLLYSANPESNTNAVFTASDGGHGTPTIGHCLAVFSDTPSTVGNNGSGLLGSSPAPSETPTRQQTRGPTQVALSGRVQHDPAVGPAPVRYVNFLAYEGYSVEILGGKHFKTPDGEFVEMKSGTQYKILVKNSHAYACHLDISIDDYDVGGWAILGGEELSIERPAYEAKKFTFYRVKSAPKDAGIESGRSENGVVKCVFTPEAFLNIPVIIADSSRPLNVNLPPSATFGDLKHEVQSQMRIRHDPDQVLALGDKVLSNADHLRGILQTSSGNLRLIDEEITITVEASSNLTFPIKVHPGKAKVHDLMEQIERELNVPIMEQKLYFEKNLLSKAPSRRLPDKLICSPRPTVTAIVPEYIHVTVEEASGDSHPVKIDKGKNLRALMEEIPSCSFLHENEEATFVFSGKQLCPSRDRGTLTSLGVCSGSKLELIVKILFIELTVCFSDGSPSMRVKCDPQETFQDLVEKVKKKDKKRKLMKVTFTMKERVFDLDQDRGPFQDYGVTHGCTLQMRVTRPSPTAAGDDSNRRLEAAQSEEGDKQMPHKQLECSLHEIGDSLRETERKKKSFLSSTTSKVSKSRRRRPNKARKEMEINNDAPPRRMDEKLKFKDCEYECAGDAPQFGGSIWGRKSSGSTGREGCRYSAPQYNDQLSIKRQSKSTVFSSQGSVVRQSSEISSVVEPDPTWRAGGTTLQGHSTQQFITAEPIKVDPSRKVELVVRLVAREDEEGLIFPKDECKPLSTLIPPAVQE